MNILKNNFFSTNFDPLEQFKVESIFHNSSYYIVTNVTLFLGLVLFILFTIFFHNLDNRKILPTIYKSLNYKFMNFLRTLLKENLNSTKYNFYIYILGIFYFITISNVIGMIPYSFTLTSHLTITFFIAFCTFVGINLVAVHEHGINTFDLFLPSGTPLPVIPFLVVIELISYIARVFSLSIRLFANMMSGHTLLKILSGFAWSNLLALSSTTYWFVAIIPFLVVLAVTSLEFLIAFLQAYVFIILTAIYLNDVLNMH